MIARLRRLLDAPPPAASHPAMGPEHAVRVRIAVWLNTVIAFAAYAMVDPEVEIVLPSIVVTIGMALSHLWRRNRNLPIKFLLAAGMLWALWTALGNLVRGAMDPRLGLAQLLLWLQVLNSFDLPRRRNLRVAVLVAGVLMVVTGTLSRTIDYGLLLVAFALTLAWSAYEAFAAETGARPAPARATAGLVVALTLVTALLATPLFLLAPRRERSLATASLPSSLNLPLPDLLNPRIRSRGAAKANEGTGAPSRSRGAYSTFSEQLDLNNRGAPSEEIVLRVQTDRPQYWRAMAYDLYDGQIWSMSRPDDVTAFTVASQPMRLGRPAGQGPGEEVTQTVYVERDQANLIYTAWAAKTLYYPTGLIWRDAYDSLRSPVALEKDMYYSVISEIPRLTPAARRGGLHARTPVFPSMARYMGLPPLSARVKAAARAHVRPDMGAYARMAALRTWLSEAYPYDLHIDPAPPHVECVDHFMFAQKAGFCQQFASALAVTGRVVGVPTRLVTGFTMGDYNPFTGLWEVRGKHAHAWVEAWLPNVGWVPFDATPDAWNPDLPAEAQPTGGNDMLGAVWAYVSPLLRGAGGVAVAAVALVLAFLGARTWRRRRPRKPPAAGAYRRLRRRAAKLGVPDDAAAAPREWLAGVRAEARLAPAVPAVEAFVARYEAVRFGGEAGDVEALAAAAEDALTAAGRV